MYRLRFEIREYLKQQDWAHKSGRTNLGRIEVSAPHDLSQNTLTWNVRYFFGFSRIALTSSRVSTSI